MIRMNINEIGEKKLRQSMKTKVGTLKRLAKLTNL